ncbi:hypothetical protein Tco_1462680 [Tanacetum coccineum]
MGAFGWLSRTPRVRSVGFGTRRRVGWFLYAPEVRSVSVQTRKGACGLSFSPAGVQMKCDIAFGIRRVTRLSEAEILHLWTRFIEPENDSIVAEHGLSSEITQSPGGSSDTSEGFENSRIFKDSERSDEEDFEDRAFSKKGGIETPQVQRSTRESRASVRYSPSANYLLLTKNGELVLFRRLK